MIFNKISKYRRFRKRINAFLKDSIINFMFLLILFSYMFLLAMIGIISDDTIYILDIVYNAIFTLEITLKLIGFGLKSNKI